MATVSQTSAEVDLVFVAGDDLTIGVEFTDKDCTGNVYTAFAFADYAAPPVLYGEVIAIDPSAGSYSVRFAHASTRRLSQAIKHRWALQEDAGGTVRTVVSGRFSAKAP